MFERWNKVVSLDKFQNLIQDIADMNHSANMEVEEQGNKIRKAEEELIRLAEEKRAAAIAAASKKNDKGAKKKGKDKEEDKVIEAPKQSTIGSEV